MLLQVFATQAEIKIDQANSLKSFARSYHFGVRLKSIAIRGAICALAIAVIPTVAVSAQVIKPGTPCKVLNQKVTSAGKTFTCIKSGKKTIWNAGIKVSTSQPSPTPSISTAKISMAGDPCGSINQEEIKLTDRILYCVKHSDGSMRLIEKYLSPKTFSNPNSPEILSACQPPDYRNGIAEGSFRWAITHPAKPVTLKNSGTLNMLIVPIDFPDAQAISAPSALYGQELKTLANWFDAYSNGKLKIRYETSEKWYRAPKNSDYYDVGEGVNSNREGVKTGDLIQSFVNLTQADFNYTTADTVLFVYPENTPSIRNSFAENLPILVNSQLKTPFEMSLASANRKYGPAWIWVAHEMLHYMGLAMHFPVNPPNWGIEWGGFTNTPVLLPWNQGILDWMNADQYFCVNGSKLSNVKLTLAPLGSPGTGLHSAFIRVSDSEVLMIVSHRKATWSPNLPDSFYGTMVALIDTSKQTSWSGENTGEDKMDGVMFPKSGVYLHPNRSWSVDRIWTRTETGDWGALMYLGDSVSYKGVQVKLIASNNFDTVEISKL